MNIIEAVLKLEEGYEITRSGLGDLSIKKSTFVNEPKSGSHALISPIIQNTGKSGTICWYWAPSEEDIKAEDWEIVGDINIK